MRLNKDSSMFVMIDVQEKFREKIAELGTLIKNCSILNQSAEILGIPLLITEQYPSGLGKTLNEIYIPADVKIEEKKSFTVFEKDISTLIAKQGKEQLIIYGIEAHICVTQTCLDAIDKSYEVFLVLDAVSSRDKNNKNIAVNRLIKAGCEAVSTEMLLFELLHSAEHPKFKEIAKLVK
ncbi:MAG: isochorismatase family protein [Candidatus Cloacimonetes bacterium]|nr:isochorismatase family protein [Candidatus Cloacimonadota bacterium]